MKAPAHSSGSRPDAPTASRAAFTLPELLITITLFVLLVGAILSAHLFGLRMSRITEAKLNASASARQALGKMTDEIRNCTSTWVGNVASNGVFVELLDGVRQSGSALLVQPTSNASNFVVYFVNPTDQSFRRTTSVPGTTTIVARSVTNSEVFRAQDFLGTVLTNNQQNHVIHLTLEFYQPRPFLPVPDYYRLETSVTSRAPDE
jgi:prepilin-type N-terminal cleavage/methylation domain-containing protein